MSAYVSGYVVVFVRAYVCADERSCVCVCLCAWVYDGVRALVRSHLQICA